jgi:hypothetical protein
MIKTAKSAVTITHVRWRDGRPRLDPGPGIRAFGITSRDLKHEDGRWFSYEEAVAESRALHDEITALRKGQKPRPKQAAPAANTLDHLCDHLFNLPEFQHEKIVDRKREVKGLSPKTVSGYHKCRRAAMLACDRLAQSSGRPNLWHVPAAAIGPNAAQALIHEVHAHSGLASARAVRAFLSQMWTRLRKSHGLAQNPWAQVDKLETLPGRIRPWEPHEFWHMVTTAEAMGLSEIADSYFLGVLHGHRQTDRLTMTDIKTIGESHITWAQSKMRNKTRVVVKLFIVEVLRQRLAAALRRREAHTVQWSELIINEASQRPFAAAGDHYRHLHAEVRKRASQTMPSCADLRDQDLRDTNQTWLDRASVDPEVMALVAGHSLNRRDHTAVQKRHYVAYNQQRVDDAVKLLAAYMLKHRPEAKKEAQE